MKFCKACVHCRPKLIDNGWLKKPTEDFSYAKCHYKPDVPEIINMVTGEIASAVYWHCSTLRKSLVEGDCGPEAIHFEARR